LTGSGLSKSSGVPTFREEDKDFFEAYDHLNLKDPKELFTWEFYHKDKKLFWDKFHDFRKPIARA